jgi:hypothetical protein
MVAGAAADKRELSHGERRTCIIGCNSPLLYEMIEGFSPGLLVIHPN